MTIRAICCGINVYLNYPNESLKECVNDSNTMRAIFANLGADPTNTFQLVDQDATKANISKALSDAVNASKPGDGLFWSHSSHGTTYTDSTGMTHEALCCTDIKEKNGEWDFDTVLTGPEVGKILAGMPKDSHVEIWWDSCFSGNGLRVLTLGGPKSKFLAHPSHNIGTQSPTPDRLLIDDILCEIVLWAACSADQTAADATSLGNGAFTYFFNKEFKADPNQARVDLITMIRKSMRLGRFQQTPHLECGADEGTNKVGT